MRYYLFFVFGWLFLSLTASTSFAAPTVPTVPHAVVPPTGLGITIAPSSATYTVGQSVTITITGGTESRQYSLSLYQGDPSSGGTPLDGEFDVTGNNEGSPFTTITWAEGQTSAWFSVRFTAAGSNRVFYLKNTETSESASTSGAVFSVLPKPTLNLSFSPVNGPYNAGQSVVVTLTGGIPGETYVPVLFDGLTSSTSTKAIPAFLTTDGTSTGNGNAVVWTGSMTSAQFFVSMSRGATGTGRVLRITNLSSTHKAESNPFDVTFVPFCNTTVYVTPDGDGSGDGNNWDNALSGANLPQALATACAGTTFLIGNGTYKPTTNSADRTASFTIASGVSVYGGYVVADGTAFREGVDPNAGMVSSTVFSGDIDNNTPDRTGNSYCLVVFKNAGTNTRFDGIQLTEANGNTATGYNAAIVNDGSGPGNSSKPVIANCAFMNNYGDAGGGLKNKGATGGNASPSLINCLFQNNSSRLGGAVHNDGSGGQINNTGPYYTGTSSPVITNCIFYSNSAIVDNNSEGGAIYSNGNMGVSSMTAINCQFTGNVSNKQGGAASQIALLGLSNNAGGLASITNPFFQSCTFTQNSSSGGSGGGLCIDGSYKGQASITISNSIFTSNTAVLGGGAIRAGGLQSGAVTVTVTGSRFANNAGNSGGGIDFASVTAVVQSSTFTQNMSKTLAGAIYNNSAYMTLTGVQFLQNTASGQGGAIYAMIGAFYIANSDFADNQGNGGGAISAGGVTYRLTNVSIRNNQSSSNGGGLLLANYTSGTLINVLLTKNQALGSGKGGAVYASSSSSHTLVNTTINRNQAAGGSHALYGETNSPFLVQNSIIWNNTSAPATFTSVSGSEITLQNSLIDPGSLTATYTNGGGNLPANPQFADEAADNLLLTACSPAIDAGKNTFYSAVSGPGSDLAGATRPYNTTVDMGAYEFTGLSGNVSITVAATPSLTIVTGNSLTLSATGAGSYTWSTGQTGSAINLTPTSTTAVSVSGISSSGCPVSTTVTVSLIPALTITAAAGSATVCTGASIGLSVTAAGGLAPFTYAWQAPPGISISGSASQSTIAVTTGLSTTGVQTLTVVVTSANGQPTSTTTVNVQVIPGIVNIIPSTTTIAGGRQISLTATNGNSFTWSTGQTGEVINVIPGQSTVYSVTGIGGNGCLGQAFAAVNLECGALIQATGSVQAPSGALGPDNCSVSLTGSGYGNSYTITGPDGYIYSGVQRLLTNFTISGPNITKPGTYRVKVNYTDKCGRTTTQTIDYVISGTACK